MGTATKIQWADHTFNPWRGCVEVHSGCDHCYAREMSKRNPAVLGRWGADGTRVVASESHWRLPLKWNRAAEAEGVRARVFCASLADVFEKLSTDRVVDSQGRPMWRAFDDIRRPDPNDPADHYRVGLSELRDRLFSLIDETPHLDWMLLTKRPENIPSMWPGGFRRNVWLYASVSDQATLDAMMPALVWCRDLVPVLGLSAEPLLGPLDLSRWARPMHRDEAGLPPAPDGDPWISPLDHVIVGGESGPHARPCDVAWIERIVNDFPDVFVKQFGSRPVVAGVPLPVRDPKGGDPTEWPGPLRVRQLPEADRCRTG